MAWMDVRRYWLLASLSAAGCGPLIGTPQDDGGDDIGTASAPGTGETTTDPTETTGAECSTNDDCQPGEYCDGGRCIYDECWEWGCCDDGCCSQRGPDGQWEVRCLPPDECYADEECWEGAYCTVESYCESIPLLGACQAPPAFVVAAQGTVPTGPSAVLAHPATDDPGQALLVAGAAAAHLELLSPPTWGVDSPIATIEAGVALVGGDFDGDAIDDVVIATEVAGRIRMLHDDGVDLAYPGIASEAPGYGVLERIAAGDLDADGDLDLAATNAGDVLALLNAGDGSFSLAAGAFADATDIAVADLDADGRAEIVSDGADVTIWRLGPDLLLEPAGTGDDWAMTDHGRLALGDIDADGAKDVVVARPVNGVTRLDLWTGAVDSPQLQWIAGVQGEYHTIRLADLDADGASDIVLGSNDRTDYTVVFATPGGTPYCATTYPTDHLTPHLEVADLDNDNRPDITTADSTGTYRVDLNSP